MIGIVDSIEKEIITNKNNESIFLFFKEDINLPRYIEEKI